MHSPLAPPVNPAFFARQALSVDHISNGRLEMGIGAGWYDDEYLGYGYEFPKASVRIGQLEEGVEIMRKMWTEDEVKYSGKYYELAGAYSNPKPVQDRVPIVVGGHVKGAARRAARVLLENKFGCVPVTEGSRLVGILTSLDIVRPVAGVEYE